MHLEKEIDKAVVSEKQEHIPRGRRRRFGCESRGNVARLRVIFELELARGV